MKACHQQFVVANIAVALNRTFELLFARNNEKKTVILLNQKANWVQRVVKMIFLFVLARFETLISCSFISAVDFRRFLKI